MSKERLEELAYNVGISLDGEKALMSSDDYDFLYNYALEQAERVQELEEALMFYADKENYKPFDGIFLSSYQNKIDEDCGEKARQALEGEAGD